MAIDLTFANQLLKLIANGAPIANIADNAASSPLTSLYWALHTADPTGGNQATSEITYTGYARVASLRSSAGLLVVGSSIVPIADFSFPNPSGAAGAIASYISLGTAVSGTGKLLWSGALLASQTITIGNPPLIKSGSTISVV